MSLFYRGLFAVLVNSDRAVGPIWAWRITRFVHAVPYWIGAAILGWLAIWFWGDLFPRSWGAAMCGGAVMFFTALDWFRDWRRG
jgi:hypothetical protein